MGFYNSLASVHFCGELLANLSVVRAHIQDEGALGGMPFCGVSGPRRRDMFTAYFSKSS